MCGVVNIFYVIYKFIFKKEKKIKEYRELRNEILCLYLRRRKNKRV
jgi:hypothetical protein